MRGQPYDLALYKAAKTFLEPAGILVIEGTMDKDTAVNMYARIANAQNNQTLKVREAAKYMASGNPNFDICFYEDRDVGPFATDCLQREFRKAGCQLSGKAAPSESTGGFADMTWADVKSKFATLFQQTRSTNSRLQERAVLDCIGTQLYHPKPDICEEPGIEYKVFTRDGFYVGHVISKEGLLKESTIGVNPISHLIRQAGPSARVIMDTNTTVRSASTIQMDGTVPMRTQIVVNTAERQNGRLLSMQRIAPSKATTMSNTTQVQFTIPIQPKKRTLLRTEYLMETGTGLLTQSEFIQSNLPLFQLSRDSWKPVFGYDYFGLYVD
jgi:hypothetical protein